MGPAHVFRGNDASENEVRSNLIKVTTGNFHDSNVFPYFFRLLISECFTNPYYPIPRHSLKKTYQREEDFEALLYPLTIRIPLPFSHMYFTYSFHFDVSHRYCNSLYYGVHF